MKLALVPLSLPFWLTAAVFATHSPTEALTIVVLGLVAVLGLFVALTSAAALVGLLVGTVVLVQGPQQGAA